jgi:hypothetical protein
MSNALYMFGAKVGSIPHGFGASTNAQGLHIPPSSDPAGSRISADFPNLG